MRTVLITGAAAGIGLAAARLFAADGWRCLLVDRDHSRLDAALRSLPRAVAAQADHLGLCADLISDPLHLELPQDIGEITAIINNAGMSDSSNSPLVDKPAEALQPLLSLNLMAPLRLVSLLGPRLARGARVVNVSSGAGLRAIPFRGAYSASKAGLIAASRALSRQRPDLCVSVLCPGFVRTELVADLIKAGRVDPVQAVAKIPLGRMASPEELGAALLFLASEDAWPMDGAVLRVDGGSSIYGGSIAFPPSLCAPVAQDSATALTLRSSIPLPALANLPEASAAGYPAVIDATPLGCGPEDLLPAIQAAATAFAATHPQQAGLTLLLPVLAEEDPATQGLTEAARMLVRSLACELGTRALRVNAIELTAPEQLEPLCPLLRYIAGTRAQFMTGEVFTPERSRLA